MSVCAHDPHCPGYGPEHDAAQARPGSGEDLLKAAPSSWLSQPVRSPMLTRPTLPTPVKTITPEQDHAVLQSIARSNSLGSLGHVYGGTVPPATIAKRRAKNSRARKARRIGRR